MNIETIESVQPIRDTVVVKLDIEEQVTKGGIFIPDTARKAMAQGTVIAVGPGARSTKTGVLVPLEVKTGDRVVFQRYPIETDLGDPNVFDVGDDVYAFLPERLVMAILEDAGGAS